MKLVRGAAVALFALAIAPPVLGAVGLTLAPFAVTQFFALVCHQDAARSFWIFGAPLAVCVRCFGTYAGAAIASWLPVRGSRAMVAAAVLANVVDFLTEVSGLHADWPCVRLALGIALGITAVQLLLRDYFLERRARRTFVSSAAVGAAAVSPSR